MGGELKEQIAYCLGDAPLEDLQLVHGVDVLQDQACIGGSCLQDHDQLMLVQVNNSCRIGSWVPGRYLRDICDARLPSQHAWEDVFEEPRKSEECQDGTSAPSLLSTCGAQLPARVPFASATSDIAALTNAMVQNAKGRILT